ncbi:MAG: prepilin-type N-terminal cleavage/methylation domain-containing protein [bacterium]
MLSLNRSKSYKKEQGFTLTEVMVGIVIGGIVLAAVFHLITIYYKERRRDMIKNRFREDIDLAFEYLDHGYFDPNDKVRRIGLSDSESFEYGASYVDQTDSIYSGVDHQAGYIRLFDHFGGVWGMWYVGINQNGKRGLIYCYNSGYRLDSTKTTIDYRFKTVIPSEGTPLYNKLDFQVISPDTGAITSVKTLTVTITLRRDADPLVEVSATKTIAVNINFGSIP